MVKGAGGRGVRNVKVQAEGRGWHLFPGGGGHRGDARRLGSLNNPWKPMTALGCPLDRAYVPLGASSVFWGCVGNC